MALKDLLVYLDPASRSPAHLRLAVDLARRHTSSITALYVREWSPEQLALRRTAEIAGRSLAEVGEIDQEVAQSIERSARELQATFERQTAQYGLSSEWRMVGGESDNVLPQHARYADLCVLGADAPRNTSGGYRLSEEMLFTSGRPVLLVPQDTDHTTLGAHVAVAWNSSRS